MLESNQFTNHEKSGIKMNLVFEKFGQKKRIVLFGFLLVINLLLFSLPGVPGNTSDITAISPDRKLPDMMGVYSPDAVHDFLTAIGPDGREAYQFMHLTTDLAFPLVYGLFFFAVLSHLMFVLESPVRFLPFLGLLAAGFDLAENFILIFITNRYPAFLPGLTSLAQVLTLAKFATITVSGITIGYLLYRSFTQSKNSLKA